MWHAGVDITPCKSETFYRSRYGGSNFPNFPFRSRGLALGSGCSSCCWLFTCGPVRSGIALKEPTEYSSKNGELNATSRWSSATSRSPRRAPAYSGGSSYARLQRHVARVDAARARWRHAAHPAEEHPAVRAGVHLVMAWAGRVYRVISNLSRYDLV